MALRKLITKPLPQLPEQQQASITDQLMAMPQFAAGRVFWNSFRDLQPWWPILVPLLLWVGVRTYRKERAALQRNVG